MRAKIVNKKVMLEEKVICCGDKNVYTVTFESPTVIDGVSVENLPVYIKTENPLGGKCKTLLTSAKSGDNLLIEWFLGEEATLVSGKLKCQLIFEDYNGSLVLNSEIFEIDIHASVSEVGPKPTPEYNQITQLQNKLMKMIEEEVLLKGEKISLLENDAGYLTKSDIGNIGGGNAGDGGYGLPTVGVEDEGKILEVNKQGEWEVTNSLKNINANKVFVGQTDKKLDSYLNEIEIESVNAGESVQQGQITVTPVIFKKGSGEEYTVNVIAKNGEKGDQGAQGIQGEKGEKGDQGAQGIQGEKGEKGDQGAQGIQGEKGEKGDQGAQGIQGEKGEKGDQGAQGIQGEKGVGIENATAGVPSQNGGYTYTNVNFALSNGTTKTVRIVAKNGADGKDAECLAIAIIDVEVLPTASEVNPQSIYRVNKYEFYTKGLFNKATHCKIIDYLPETGDPVYTNLGLTAYYELKSECAYGYVTENLATQLDLKEGWFMLEEIFYVLGYTYGGIINSVEEIKDDSYVYLIRKPTLYCYNSNCQEFQELHVGEKIQPFEKITKKRKVTLQELGALCNANNMGGLVSVLPKDKFLDLNTDFHQYQGLGLLTATGAISIGVFYPYGVAFNRFSYKYGTGDEGSVTILGCNILIESGPAGILTDACLYENLVDSGGVRVNSTNINEYLNDEYFDFYVYM